MDQVYSTKNGEKGQHLTKDERVMIQLRLKDGWKANRIAREIGCSANTVRNEIRRETVTLLENASRHDTFDEIKSASSTRSKNTAGGSSSSERTWMP